MNIIILGAAGFIGTNLALNLAKDKTNKITLVDQSLSYFNPDVKKLNNCSFVESDFQENTQFSQLLKGQDIVYHLVSTNIPSNSGINVSEELKANIVVTSKMLDSCVAEHIQKVIFISSGGTVYGKQLNCPLKEDLPTYPINSYGLQKITIEKLLYMYEYMYGLDYRVVRLANPYGPYQRPNGKLGAVTTFTYKAIKNEPINLYGDGSIVRDFIYIQDAINAILTIANGEDYHKVFNVGSGKGTSIKELLILIKQTLRIDLIINKHEGRKADVPVNYLDISRYQSRYGQLNHHTLKEGILLTKKFLEENY